MFALCWAYEGRASVTREMVEAGMLPPAIWSTRRY